MFALQCFQLRGRKLVAEQPKTAWTALDAESTLIVSYMVGTRDADAATIFMPTGLPIASSLPQPAKRLIFRPWKGVRHGRGLRDAGQGIQPGVR